MKILILPKYDQSGASSRYRLYNYLPYFEKNNIKWYCKPLLKSNYIDSLYNKRRGMMFLLQAQSILDRIFFLLFNSAKYDFIIIEKELFPNIPYFVEHFLLRNSKYTLDFDDYIATGYKLNLFKRFFRKQNRSVGSKSSISDGWESLVF